MTTEQAPTETAETGIVTREVISTEESSEGPAELRAALKREQDENADMRSEMLELRLQAIGLTSESMLGKAIAKEYKGSLDQDSVTAYAESEYGYEGTTEVTPPEVEVTERLEELNKVSEPVTPAEPVDRAAETVAKVLDPDATIEDAEASMNAKLAQYIEEHVPT